MSNCIDIRNEEVLFKKDEIDLLKLQEILDSVPESRAEAEELDKADDGLRAFCWWFLKRNTIVMESGAVIKFGRGNSTHTWRDFRGLLNRVISPIMLKNKSHTFKVEDDGFPGWGPLPVIFGQTIR